MPHALTLSIDTVASAYLGIQVPNANLKSMNARQIRVFMVSALIVLMDTHATVQRSILEQTATSMLENVIGARARMGLHASS